MQHVARQEEEQQVAVAPAHDELAAALVVVAEKEGALEYVADSFPTCALLMTMTMQELGLRLVGDRRTGLGLLHVDGLGLQLVDDRRTGLGLLLVVVAQHNQV